MKKIILFVFLFQGFNTLFAQDSLKTKSKRFFIGVNFSPDLTYRTIRNTNPNDTLGNWITKSRNSTEIPKFGFTVGVNFYYSTTKHISIEFGLQFSNKGYEQKEENLTYGSTSPRRGYNTSNTSNLPVKGGFTYNYNYLDIPIKANFVFGKKKTKFITSAGLTTNILFYAVNTFKGQKADGSSYKSTGTATNEYNRVNLSPMISSGIQYNINQKMFFRIEPTFRYGVLKTVSAPITEHLWSAGVNCSFYF